MLVFRCEVSKSGRLMEDGQVGPYWARRNQLCLAQGSRSKSPDLEFTCHPANLVASCILFAIEGMFNGVHGI
jgi:hypothetical protein